MELTNAIVLSLVIFLPAVAALVLALFVPKNQPDAAKLVSLGATIIVFALTVWMALPAAEGSQSARFEMGVAAMQNVFNFAWIPSFNIYYFMGLDGISFSLVILTTFVFLLSMLASWNIQKNVKAYCILFLLLETGVIGVFLALDFFLFYVFWEFMLLPMYFLIGVWGGPRREYAAIKFFLYTFVGGVAMLIAILALYFTSDLRELAKVSDFRSDNTNVTVSWKDLHLPPEVDERLGRGMTHVDPKREDAQLEFHRTDKDASKPLLIDFVQDEGAKQVAANLSEEHGELLLKVTLPGPTTAANVAKALQSNPEAASLVQTLSTAGPKASGIVLAADDVRLAPFNPDAKAPVHTFNILALTQMGQHTKVFDQTALGMSIQMWAFILLFVGFAIKVPAVPVHTWLPDAHVEAPTPISMILAGVLLKLGGYGIIRICYPICPDAGYQLAWLVCGVGVVSMVYGAFAAMAQKDFKRLVAYSSVSHMGYVVLGIGVWSAVAGTQYSTEYWAYGMNGAMFQMLAHGFSSAGMFFMVGVIYDRVHHRNLDEFGGLFAKMPVYSGLAIGIFFAGLGLPGLCGFIGEIFVTLSVWKFSVTLAVIAASVVILTAGYILWTLQRVYLGAEYRGPHPEALTPMTYRERCIAVPLLAAAILFGVYPRAILDYVSPSVNAEVQQLADWKMRADGVSTAVAGAPVPQPAQPKLAEND